MEDSARHDQGAKRGTEPKQLTKSEQSCANNGNYTQGHWFGDFMDGHRTYKRRGHVERKKGDTNNHSWATAREISMKY